MVRTNCHCDPATPSLITVMIKGEIEQPHQNMLSITTPATPGMSWRVNTNPEGDKPDIINTIFYWAAILDTKNKIVCINISGNFLYCSYKNIIHIWWIWLQLKCNHSLPNAKQRGFYYYQHFSIPLQHIWGETVKAAKLCLWKGCIKHHQRVS